MLLKTALIMIILPTGILNACGIFFKEVRNHLHSSLHSNTLTDVRVADGIDASEKLSWRSTLIRYNETKPQVHLSDEMTHRFTLWWILSAEIDFIYKSTVREATLRSCVCVDTDASTHVTTGRITLPGSSKGSLITSFKIISINTPADGSWSSEGSSDWRKNPQD